MFTKDAIVGRIMSQEVKKYLKYLKEVLSYKDSTIKTYEYILNDFVESNKKPENYLNKFSGSYRNRNINILSSFYEYLVSVGVKSTNEIKPIKKSKQNKNAPIFANATQLESIISSIKEDGFKNIRNKTLLELGIAVGARINEFVNIKLSDLDIDNKKMEIYGKGKSRWQDLTEPSIKILKKYLPLRALVAKNDFLFVTETGEQLKYPYYVIKPLIGNLTPHQFNRHSLAVGLIRNGMDLDQVRRVMRHSSIATTSIYLSAEDPSIQEQLKKKHPRA